MPSFNISIFSTYTTAVVKQHTRLPFLAGHLRGFVLSQRSQSVRCMSGMSPSLITRIVASSVCIAERSGSIIRSIMKTGNLGIVDKGSNDLQTEADRSVQRCITSSLLQLFPGLTIIGEEDEERVSKDSTDAAWIEETLSQDVLQHESNIPVQLKAAQYENICVWVDPLDGTAEYAKGLLENVTVLIGVAVDGKSVAGVVHQPYYKVTSGDSASQLGRTIWGIVGLGAFGISQRPSPLERVVVTTRLHETVTGKKAVAACQPTQVIKVGGAGLKVLLLIEGKAHAYVHASPGCKKWDTCAPEAVLRAVGGLMTDIHGNQLEYHPTVKKQNSGGVLATGKASDHPYYLTAMPDDVKSLLKTNSPEILSNI